jgi:plasmid stability protein
LDEKEAATMSSTLTVRDIDPGDKSWLKREARQVGVSMEEFVRQMIHEKRLKTERRPQPSEVFGRYFGREHGVEMPPRALYRYGPVEFTDETGT